MENQHRKISGYRDLSQTELDLLNRIKAKGDEVGTLIAELKALQNREYEALCMADRGSNSDEDRAARSKEFQAIEDAKTWCEFGRVDIQSGFMKLVRSVGRPTTFC